MQSIYIVYDPDRVVAGIYSEEWVAAKVAASRQGHTVTKQHIHDAYVQCDAIKEEQNGPVISRLHCKLPIGHDQPTEHEFGELWKGSPKRV
jgi:hypothetical protein